MKLLKFEQPGCVPCKMVQTLLAHHGVTAESINPLEDTEAKEKFAIMGTPTLVLLNDSGEEVGRVVGFNPPAIVELIEKMKGVSK